MKKLIATIVITFAIFGISAICYADETITVNITVTDITDVNNPFNVLVPRRSLTVEYKDLDTYGGTFRDIETADGITYLHALAALHEEIYGTSGVSQNLMLDPGGETHIFMGKSIDSIMYKNGDDIFTLPQLVELKDGDEINVCLYTAGHAQQIATFDKSVIRVPIGEEISFTASEHYDSPVENTPISGAWITDENGILLEDGEGNFITSDDMGNFTISYPAEGEYIISIMPEINYYMDGTITPIIEYVPVTTEHTWQAPEGKIISINDTPPELRDHWYKDKPPSGYAVFLNWDSENGIELEYTTTELVETITGYAPDEPKQMISYTPPFCVIDVTDDLIVDSVYFSIGEISDAIYISLKNSDKDSCTVWCAAYDDDGRLLEVQKQDSGANMNFVFGTGADYYKVMFWDGMMPKDKAYCSK